MPRTKRKMKKTLILLILALCLVLASCGDKTENNGSTTTAAKGNDTTSAAITTTGSKAATSDPATESEPEATESEPEASDTEPEASDTEPEASDTEPVASGSSAESKSLLDIAPQELKDVADFQLILGDKYCIKSEAEEMGQKSSTCLYRNGDKAASIIESGSITMKMVKKGDKAYYVFDSAKKYFETDASEMNDFSFEISEGETVEYDGVSEKEFNGKTVKVYTFKGEVDGVASAMAFYVDGDDIVALEADGNIAPMDVSDDVPDIFDIPADYTEADQQEALSLLFGGLTDLTGTEE